MTFETLGLSAPLLKAVAERGYTSPSPIQSKAIPVVLEGRDVMAAAQTGTGKTAGFTLPLIDLLQQGQPAAANQVRALVLTPTRELAAQVGESVATYGKYVKLRSAVVFGGVKINPQMMKLRKGADVLVATPGRLLDLYSQNAIKFNQLEVLVLDEADRMLDMGFIHDIRKILALLPAKRQNLMFSATFSNEIRELAKTIVHNPVEVSVSPPNTTVDAVEQWVIPVDKTRKSGLLIKLIEEQKWQQVLVFSRTKHGANRLTTQLIKKGIKAAAIHGNKSQNVRTKALADFKSGAVHVLVATDIAARGLDISQLPQVVNLDLPNVPEDYVHRIGRTGRAGASGTAISLVSADEVKQLRDIERLIKKVIPRQHVDGFEPKEVLPESQLDTRPFQARKPKKPKRPSQGANSNNSHAQTRKPAGPSRPQAQRNERGGQGQAAAGANKPKSKPRSNAKPQQRAKPAAQGSKRPARSSNANRGKSSYNW